MLPVVAIPVKRFFVAKRRLASVLDAAKRSLLGRELAAFTIAAVVDAGLEPVVLAADDEVAQWAADLSVEAIIDSNGGLDAAAGSFAQRSVESARPWMIVHADLPLVSASELGEAAALVVSGAGVVAPSNDGGTSLIAGHSSIRFAYGPGSFHRHLAALGRPEVLVRLGLALDLDDASDLAAARRHPRGEWLREYASQP